MSHMKKVLRVEMHREVTEYVVKERVHDYAAGGFVHTQRIDRTTRETPRVILECGHHRQQHAGMREITAATKLLCHECEYAATAT